MGDWEGPLSSSTQTAELAGLRRFFRWAGAEGLRPDDPARAPPAGLAVLAADTGKGTVAALAGLLLGGWWAGCAGLVLAMAGHAWPPWSGFRGGRSVACLTGGGLVLGPLPGAIAICFFLVLRRPLGLWRAAAIGLLSYPPLFGVLVADRWLLIGVGAAYLVLVAAWMLSARRRIAAGT